MITATPDDVMSSSLTSSADLSSSGGDFRDLIQKKLAAKQSQLGQTVETIRKYVTAPPMSSTVERQNSQQQQQQQPRMARFRDRLGPPTAVVGSEVGGQSRTPMSRRLGPRVSNNHDEDEEEEEEGEKKGVLLSRVYVEQKSREEVLAEKKATENTNETQRNRRMFGNLLGTLQKFRQDESRVKEKDMKKREIEKKIEEKTEKEKEEAKTRKKELLQDRKQQQHEIKILQIQMERAEEFSLWEASKRKEMQYIRTKSSSSNPPIYYLPKMHTEETLNLLEETMELIESEIKVTKAKFEDDLLKMESKIHYPHMDPEAEEEEEEEEETENTKPKSIVVSAVRTNQNKDREERQQPHKRVRAAESLEDKRISIREDGARGSEVNHESSALKIKTEKDAPDTRRPTADRPKTVERRGREGNASVPDRKRLNSDRGNDRGGRTISSESDRRRRQTSTTDVVEAGAKRPEIAAKKKPDEVVRVKREKRSREKSADTKKKGKGRRRRSTSSPDSSDSSGSSDSSSEESESDDSSDSSTDDEKLKVKRIKKEKE